MLSAMPIAIADFRCIDVLPACSAQGECTKSGDRVKAFAVRLCGPSAARCRFATRLRNLWHGPAAILTVPWRHGTFDLD
jgi:hypothetical protein